MPTPKELSSAEHFEAELEEKQSRMGKFLGEHGLSAILLRRHENIAWATRGQVEARVRIPSETAVASLLLTREGGAYYLAPKNEAPRLAEEEFAGLDYEPVLYPWHGDGFATMVKKLAGGGQIGTDSPAAGLITVDTAALRASLTLAEIERYRWLGRKTAEVTASALQELEPGITEYQMEALVAEALLSEGILPSVLLMAVDDRILKYKHAVARGRSLERFGMLNLCSRKWGLAISITRFVHFGELPPELAHHFDVAARVNAALLHATQAGVTSAQLFLAAKDAYAAEGYPGEEEYHHQGGATGYGEREWVATPTGTEVVLNHQAFAWNPSIRGGKVEDTVLLVDGAIETLTATPDLPVVDTEGDGSSYRSAGVLVKS